MQRAWGWGRRIIYSSAPPSVLSCHPLPTSTPFPVLPPPPSPGCLKHKQTPVFTSCHSGFRQAGNRNQDCLDWGLDRTGRSHAQQGVQDTFSGQAEAATGSRGAAWGWNNPHDRILGTHLVNHKAQLFILEKTELRFRQGRRLVQGQIGFSSSTRSITQVARLPVQCSSHSIFQSMVAAHV